MSELQNNEQWHKDRESRVTASRVAGILNIPTAHQNRAGVMREMVRDYFGYEREISEYVQKKILDRGTALENDAIKLLEKAKDILIISTGFQVHPQYNWIGASPDGIVCGKNIGVEAKNPLHQLKPIKEMPHYLAQIQMQCACCGFEGVWFVNRLEKNGVVSVAFEYVEADPDWLALHFEELEKFYEEYCEAIAIPEDENPHLKPLIETRDAPEWITAVKTYRAAKIQADTAAKKVAEAKERLIELAEGKKSQGGGALVFPTEKSGSISYSRIVKDLLPALTDKQKEKYKGKPSVSWAVRLGSANS